MSCGEKWRAAGAKAVSIHELEDSHLENILKYLTSRKIHFYLMGESHKVREVDYTLYLMSKEARQRGMDPEKITEDLEHPDPVELALQKGLLRSRPEPEPF